MTVVEELVVVPETEEEPALVHTICCVTWGSTNTDILKTLCGIPIDDLTDPVEGVDVDCERCEALANTDYCPVFAQCIADDEE